MRASRGTSAGGLLVAILIGAGLLMPGCSTPPSAGGGAAGEASGAGRAGTSETSSVEITSDPRGALVLVNDQPVGRTPLKVKLNVTRRGFCADYVTIKARFAPTKAGENAGAIDVQLTPRDRVPLSLVFAPDGVQRRMR